MQMSITAHRFMFSQSPQFWDWSFSSKVLARNFPLASARKYVEIWESRVRILGDDDRPWSQLFFQREVCDVFSSGLEQACEKPSRQQNTRQSGSSESQLHIMKTLLVTLASVTSSTMSLVQLPVLPACQWKEDQGACTSGGFDWIQRCHWTNKLIPEAESATAQLQWGTLCL